jgi:hypothetical protein
MEAALARALAMRDERQMKERDAKNWAPNVAEGLVDVSLGQAQEEHERLEADCYLDINMCW